MNIRRHLSDLIGDQRSRLLWRSFRKATGGKPSTSAARRRILIWPFRAFDLTLVTEALIGEALRLRGHSVGMLFCNGLIDQCDHMQWGDNRMKICRACRRAASRSVAAQSIDVLDASELVSEADRRRATDLSTSLRLEDLVAYCEDGVDVGAIARASALRFLLKGRIDPKVDGHILRTYFRNALIILSAAKAALDRYRPDQVLTSHGIYISWGIISALCRARGIGLVVWAQGYRKNSILFVRGDTYHRVLPAEPPEKAAAHRLSSAERHNLLEYVSSKRTGARDYIAYNRGTLDDPTQVASSLGLDRSRSIIALFTNVLWDASLIGESTLFGDQIEWLVETIRFAATQPQLQFVIRIHPAEVKHARRSRQQIATELTSAFPSGMPPNVVVVRPEDNLSSYAIADLCSLAVVFSTKLGLELAVAGTRTVVVGTPLYRGKGFTIEPTSRSEYFRALTEAGGSLDEVAREKAIVYADYYLNHLHYEVNLIDRRPVDVSDLLTRLTIPPVRLAPNVLDLLHPGRDAALDDICDRITTGTEFGLRKR